MSEDFYEWQLLSHFRCLPSQLDQEDPDRLAKFLYINSMVEFERNEQQKSNAKMSR